MSNRNRFQGPRSPQWDEGNDSLSELSPYDFPYAASPARPGVSNLRTQQPRAEKNRFFPDQGGQQVYDVPKIPPVLSRRDDTRKVPGNQRYDSSFVSRNIVALGQDNFEQYVTPMEKVLVYFYNSRASRYTQLEYQFSEAADRMHNPSYGFGAVDCAFEQSVCNYFQIAQPAVLKLFSNGQDLSTINNPINFSSDEMQRLMAMSPVLRKPRGDDGKRKQAQYR